MIAPLLDIADLHIAFHGMRGPVEAVRGVSFTLGRERLALVGGSGAGKSLIGRSILRLLPPGARMSATRFAFDGIDVLRASEGEMRRLRARRIALVLQDAKFSLNPMMTVGAQIDECFRLHRAAAPRAARVRTLEILDAVRLADPARVYRLYPHQLSGGMAQRVMIAMMLAPEPDLLIADEPTSALDGAAAQQVLDVLDELVRRRGMGLLFISHDLDLVAGFCDRILVLEAGAIVESCAAGDLARATHPYTRRLLAARPRLAVP